MHQNKQHLMLHTKCSEVWLLG